MAAEELASIRKQCVESLYDCTDYVLKYLDGDEKKSELDKLKSYIQGYCSLDELLTSKASEGLICENDNLDAISKKIAEWRPKSEHSNHEYMKGFLNKIKNKEATSSQDNSELTITSTTQLSIDPITKEQIQIPVKNTVCGHVYDEKSISEYMKLKNRVKCPYVGCSNAVPLTKKCLVRHEIPVEMNSTPAYNKDVMTPVEVTEFDDDENTLDL